MIAEEEKALIKQAKTDIRAFAKLYDYYFDRVFLLCKRRLPDIEIAKEISSEVFEEVLHKLHKFDENKNVRFGTWLYKFTSNRIIDYFRKKKSYSIDFTKFQISDGVFDVDKDIKDETRKMMINIVLDKIGQNHADIIVKRYIMEMEISEIADEMNIKTSAVNVLIHRSLQNFKKKFTEIYGDTEIF